MKLVVATGNPHKLGEIRELFALPGLELQGLDGFPGVPEVVEDGDTFEANAIKKACEVALHLDRWTLADDSGLEVDALDGAPGVHSARYAGRHGDDDGNNRKLLRDMEGVAHRAARFRCVIALSDPRGETRTVSGAVEGTIADTCHGDHGFGYDVLFIPAGYRETFGVLDPEIKHGMSHRGEALRAAARAWGDLLSRPDPN